MADQPQSNRVLVVGGGIIALLGVGWFVLSHVVMDTDIPDALGESLGVVLALAVVASIFGAVLSGRGKPG
jgi:uncharacterized membrane protein YccC